MIRILKEALTSPPVKTSLLVVLIYGVLVGYFAWHIYFEPVAKTYPVSWQAPWITYSDEELSQSYFRKKIHLTQSNRHAWIKIMAPEKIKVYINGNLIKSKEENHNVTVLIDLTQALKPGTNVIAIATYRSTYPGTSKIVVEGMYEDWQGIQHKIQSDASWKVAQFGQQQFPEGPEWFESTFSDLHWDNAYIRNIPDSTDYSKVNYNPLIYTKRVQGQWLWAASVTFQKAYLRYNFNLAGKPEDAWVRIAAKQGYHLIVNGIHLGDNQQYVGINSLQTTSSQNLDIYNITPFLGNGLNTIAISGIGDSVDHGILMDGVIIDQNSNQQWISTQKDWQASSTAISNWIAPEFNDSQWASAKPVGPVTITDRLVKKIIKPTPPPSHLLTLFTKKILCISLIGLLTILGWLLVATTFIRIKDVKPSSALITIATLYSLPLLFLITIYLVGFDLRYGQSFVFQKIIVLISLGLLSTLILALFFSKKRQRIRVTDTSPINLYRYLEYIGIGILVVLGLFLRLQGLDYKPLGGDEVKMAIVSQQTLEKGYPSAKISSQLKEKVLTTSEIVPYPFALFLKLFSSELIEFKLRLASAIFGTITIFLIYFTGKHFFNKRTGGLAAVLYTLLPLAINISQFARYPALTQCLVLLTSYLMYQCFSYKKLNHRYLFFATIVSVLTYLSWEGTTLFFVALAISLISIKGKDISWIKDKYLWLTVMILVLVVFLQLSNRFLLNSGILSIGSGIGDMTLTARWEQPKYNLFVFIQNLFVLKNLFILSLIAVIGLPLALKNKALLYCYTLLLIPILVTTNFIEVQSLRHVYHVLPFLILVASAVFIYTLDCILDKGPHLPSIRMLSIIRVLTKTGFISLLVITANDYFLQLDTLPGTNAPRSTRLDYGDDGGIRGIAEILRQQSLPDDKILSVAPHKILYYYGKVDFYIQTFLKIPVVVANDAPIALHRLTGSPLINNGDELKEVLNKNRRVWVVLSKRFAAILSPQYFEYFKKMSLVFEDKDTWLYLWEK